MPQVITLVRRLALGVLLGQAFLVLGVLDIVRARVMAEATGIYSFSEFAPVAHIIFFLSHPVDVAMQNQDQDPISFLW